MNDQTRSPARSLRIFLRDFRMVEATVSFAGGQSLAAFFTHRKSYLTLREALWAGTGERVENAVLKVEQVLWAAAVAADVPLAHVPAAAGGRTVELQLDGGLLVRARLIVSQQQRIGDYLEAAGRFVPLMDAQLLRSGRPPRRVNVQLGDIVLNQDAIQAVWEPLLPVLTTVVAAASAVDLAAAATGHDVAPEAAAQGADWPDVTGVVPEDEAGVTVDMGSNASTAAELPAHVADETVEWEANDRSDAVLREPPHDASRSDDVGAAAAEEPADAPPRW